MSTPLWFTLIMIFLATHRFTRLMTRDEIPLIKEPREKLLDWLDPRDDQNVPVDKPVGGFARFVAYLGRAIAYLLECDWCTSAYTGGLVVFVTCQFTSVPLPWLVWAAASSVTGLIAGAEARQEQNYKIAELEEFIKQAEVDAIKAAQHVSVPVVPAARMPR